MMDALRLAPVFGDHMSGQVQKSLAAGAVKG